MWTPLVAPPPASSTFARPPTMPSSTVSQTIPRRSRRRIRRPCRARPSTCRMASRFCKLRPVGVFPLTKRVKWIVDGTSLPDGTPLSNAIPGGASPANNYLPGLVVGNSGISFEVSQNGSQPTDFAVSHSSYIVNHAGGPTGGAVIANTRSDTIIYGSPTNYVWGGVDRLVWCGSQTPSGAPARGTCRALRADDPAELRPWIRQASRCRNPISGLPASNTAISPASHRARSAAAALTVEMDWFGNGPDDGNRRQIQSLVVGQHNTSGAPVEISRDYRRLPGRRDTLVMPIRCSTSTFRSRHRSSTPPTPSRWQELRPFEWRLAMQLPLSPPIATGSPMTPPRIRCVGTRAHCPTLSARASRLGRSVFSQQCDTAELPVRQHRLPGRQHALHDHASGSEQRFIRDRFHIFRARFRQCNHRDDRRRHGRQQPDYASAERSLPHRLGCGFELA